MNSSSSEHSYFWLKRLHTITGFILACAFFALFLFPYSTIFSSEPAFNQLMVKIDSIPLLGWIEFVFIGVPLVFHMMMGLMIVHSGQINVFSYSYYKNWMYALERICGLILIPFVAYHIYATKLSIMFSSRHLDARLMHTILSPTWAKTLYIAGIVSAAFYFGNGLASALTTWGITASRRSRAAASILGWIVTIVIAMWGVKIILEF